MKVVVEIMTGPLFFIEVDNEATVADLKKEIGTQQKLPSDRVIIVPADKDNEDEERFPISEDQDEVALVDCGIKDGSRIFIFFNPIDDGSKHHLVFDVPEFLISNLPDSIFENL